jgi:transcription initiation factor TFIIB
MDLFPTLQRSTTTPDEPWPDLVETEAPRDGYRCPACVDNPATQNTGSDVICTGCGTVLDTPLDWTAEYRFFSSDAQTGGSDPSRCGFPMNPLLPESSLGTVILNKGMSPMMRRIKRYHMWNIMPYRERTLWGVFDGLQVRAANAGISTAVIDEAKELYAQLTATAICRGQTQRDAMLAACLWESLRRHDAPRMPRDVAEIFSIPLRQATKGIKQFQHLLAIRTAGDKTDTYTCPADAKTKSALPPAAEETTETIAARAQARRARPTRTTTYEDFIQPFLTNLAPSPGKAHQLEATVRHVCARTEELGVVPENTPPSLTASVIVFVATELGIRLDLTEVARVCGISAVTIQKCVKRLNPWKEKLLGE